MTNDLLKHWIDQGQTVLPTLLLKHYRDLGISNNELVLILQIKSYIDKGEAFPNTEEIAKNMHLAKDNVFTLSLIPITSGNSEEININ